MRKKVQDLMRYVYLTLIFAIILPAIYILGMERGNGTEYILYVRCLIIALPVVLMDIAKKRCKTLFSYLGSGILIFALMGFLAKAVIPESFDSILKQGYYVAVLFGTFVFFIARLIERVSKKPQNPSFYILIYFVLIYVFAKNVNSAAVCNEALFSCIFSFLAGMIFQYLERTDTYLSLNQRVCNLPSRRIYGIGNGIFLCFLCFVMLSVLPSIYLIKEREYRDFREWVNEREVEIPDWMKEEEQENAGNSDPMQEVMEAQEVKETPFVLKLFFYGIGIAILLWIIKNVYSKTKGLFLDFKENIDENGDVVEKLQPEEKRVKIKKTKIRKKEQTELEIIREKYKKEIRKHRKDLPECYESPYEIETKAGIAETKEGKELHECYERARYTNIL